MKAFYLIFFLFFITFSSYSQIGSDTVSLITEGTGITNDAAVNSSLRAAIEQAFGAFISSKTEILNDSLISDKIISVSNGNIKSYKILSSVNLNNELIKVTLQSTVSINSLQSFCKNNGVVSEYEGGMFARNLAIQKLNEENEFKAILNITETVKELANSIWDFKMDVASPSAINEKWNIPITIKVLPNKNIDIMQTYFIKSICGVGMSLEQVETYTKINKPVFKFLMYVDSLWSNSRYDDQQPVYDWKDIYLRNKKSLALLVDMLYYLQYSHGNFIILDGVDTINIIASKEGNASRTSRNFKINRTIIEDNWSFFPDVGNVKHRVENKYGNQGRPYRFCFNYYNNYYADNYSLYKKMLINSYNDLKRQSENYAKDAEYYKRQIASFADSSKCFCYLINPGQISEIPNGTTDNFIATGMGQSKDNIHLMMRINPYGFYGNYYRSIISINKIVTEEHLSKIKDIQVIPATIIDKIE